MRKIEVKTKKCFTRKQRKLYRILLMAESLEKKLSWIPSCKDGLEKMVEFFMEITPLEEYYYSSVGDLFFFSKRKRQLIYNLKKFVSQVGKSKHGWNRTKEEEVPSVETIYICVDIQTAEDFEDKNMRVYTTCLNKCLDKKQGNYKEMWEGQLKKEVDVMNKFSLNFLNDNYLFLGNSLKAFRESE